MRVNRDDIGDFLDATAVIAELKQIEKEQPALYIERADFFIETTRRTDDRGLLASLLLEKCVFLNHHSQYQLSNECAFECFEIARMLGDNTMQASALKMAGVNYNFTGELTNAREAYSDGIKVLEHSGSLDTAARNVLASLYYNLFTLYREFEIDSTRLQYIETAHRLFTETENKQGIARCYISYANHYPGIKDTERALEYHNRARELFKEIGDTRGEGNCEINIGFSLCVNGSFDTGMKHLEHGTELLKLSGSVFYIFNAYHNMAEAYRLQKKYNEAIKYYQLAEDLSSTTQLKLNMALLYQTWALTLEEMGSFAEALERHKKYVTEKERAYHFDKSSAVSDTRMLFELEERKRESAFLKKKNAEIEEYTRKLETSNYELRQFAHVASHDLKEPLRMVTMYMQLLERKAREKLDMEERQYLYFAKEGANRMYDLIRSLLELSKIKSVFKTETVDLNEVLKEVTEFLQPDITAKKLAITCTGLPEVTAGKVYMVQLFENLISNAAKFNNGVNPQLEISYLKADNYYYFSFCDNGIGIQEKYRSRVFEIFQRLHFRNEYEGTGIGLTMCKKIVEQLNGRIWIEDGKTGGCCVRFTIPV